MECTSESCTIGSGGIYTCGSGKSYYKCSGSECCQVMDPVEYAKQEWHKAFFQALHEAHVEGLRKRIKSMWRPSMDKAADVVIESLGEYWQAMVTMSEAKKELDAEFQKIFSEANKQGSTLLFFWLKAKDRCLLVETGINPPAVSSFTRITRNKPLKLKML